MIDKSMDLLRYIARANEKGDVKMKLSDIYGDWSMRA